MIIYGQVAIPLISFSAPDPLHLSWLMQHLPGATWCCYNLFSSKVLPEFLMSETPPCSRFADFWLNKYNVIIVELASFLFLGRPYSFQWNKWWRSYKCIVLALSVEYCEPTLLIKDFYQVQLVAGWPCREVMQGVLWYPHIRYRQECWWYHPALHQLSRRKVKPGTMCWPLQGSTPGNGWFKQTFQFPIKDARLQNM